MSTKCKKITVLISNSWRQCPKLKDIQFTLMYDKENMYMLTSDTLEPANVWHVLEKKLSKRSLTYQNIFLINTLLHP